MSNMPDSSTPSSSTASSSRWSTTRYTNTEIPSYVPAEAFTFLNGQFLRAFRLRAIVHDLQRLLKTQTCDQYFVNIPLTPTYDETTGERNNTPYQLLSEKRVKAITELSSMHRLFDDRLSDTRGGKEILRKIRFTKEQMDSGAWGAIIGARGMVHQKLEKEFQCRIVLAGRGITDPMKDSNFNAVTWAYEDPHVRLSAASEQNLQAAAERIEWILSDDPEAVEFREQNRRRTAQVEGRYDPRTWVSATDRAKAAAAGSASSTAEGGTTAGASGVGHKRGREHATEEEAEKDDDLEALLGEFDD